MKKTILSALIAATALVPVMATAQEWQGRRGNGGGDPAARQAARAERQAARAEQPTVQRAEGQSFNRDAFRAQRQAERAAQPAGQTFDREAYRAQRQAQQAAQPSGQGFDREAFRAQRQAQRAGQPQAPVQQVSSQSGQRSWSGDRAGFGRGGQVDRRNDGRGFDAGPAAREAGRGDRRYFDSAREAGRQDYRRDQNRGGNAGAGYNRGNGYDRGSGYNRGNDWNRGDSSRWNRGWRNDNRYNWQSWRGQNRNAYRLPRYYAPRGYNYGYQRFGIGVTLGSILFSQNYWINDPWDYRLPPAYGPYRWVRYYNDALLVDIDTGEVVDVINDIFW
jgi:hypothetical protein